MADQEPQSASLEQLLADLALAAHHMDLHDERLYKSPEAVRILSETPEVQRRVAKRLIGSCFRFCAERDDAELLGITAFPLAIRIIRKDTVWRAADWVEVFEFLLQGNLIHKEKDALELRHQRQIADELAGWMAKHGTSIALTNALRAWKTALNQAKPSDDRYWEGYFQKLEGFLAATQDRGILLPIEAGEAWSDVAMADLKAMPTKVLEAWLLLIRHCQFVSTGTPSSKWQRDAAGLVSKLGFDEFKQRLLIWFPLVDEPRTIPVPMPDYSRVSQSRRTVEAFERAWIDSRPDLQLVEQHSVILKGLALCCAALEDKELARALTALALSTYRKLPGKGPREVKVGNACVAALGLMPGLEGVYQLALLKVRVKFGTAQKGVEKALTAAAERVGLPRDELEEMAVPAYGLTEVGRSVERFGEFTAELRVTGTTSVEVAWFKADGKPVKSVPAAVKQSHAEDLKELQTAAKDIARMLPAQRERLDSLFLQQREWPLAVWRERYLDHPLVGVLARRLIWEFTTDGKATAGIWLAERRPPARREVGETDLKRAGSETGAPPEGGALVDLDLRPIAKLGEGTTVRLWHPIGKDVDEIVAWRAWLDEQQIQQPFKQAHREVYLLTDAERRTRTYSNRYAAHILKQHQFNALAALRGWKNKLRLMVDAEYPPATLHLPKWNLRSEFWIEGIGDNYGTDMNESGVYLRVATDQVRFYW